MKELIPAFLFGVLASLLAAGVLIIIKRYLLRYQEELLRHRKELEMQRELIERQQEYLRLLGDKLPDLDKRTLDATDELLTRAYKSYEAGAYDAAIIIAAAALESSIRSASPSEEKELPFRQLVNVATEAHRLDRKDEEHMLRLWDLRNKLIHSLGESRISASDAKQYLENVTKILLSAFNRV